MTTDLVWRLLRRNISPWQLAGYALANLVGVTIILLALQFYSDAVEGMTRGVDNDFLVVSKSIGLLDRNTAFTPGEIEDIERQPWAASVGQFEASRFRAAISVDFQGHTLSTETFFESLPDRYFDHLPRHWDFDPERGEVPIILSRDYLSLYNLGFASGRGLPTLRDSEVSMIPLQITVAGRGRVAHLTGYIAGFSSRISTIAVPEQFMHWANSEFAPLSSIPKGPSRLVIEVNDPGNPDVRSYLSRHSLEIAGDKLDNSETGYFLRLVTGIVMGVGVLITLLAFGILTLSIFLLVNKNRDKLRDLIYLGYYPTTLARYYNIMVIAINATVTVIALIAMALLRPLWTQPMERLDMSPGTITSSILVGITLFLVITALNIFTVHRQVNASCC